MSERFDVLVIGAGISGIGAGYRLQTMCPNKTYAILEARDAIGGTWDLFRYPGIRSDSDMFTLGFPWNPWDGDKTIADGDKIRDYIERTAAEFGITPKIRFGHRVEKASWSSDAAEWRVEVLKKDGTRVTYTCRFLYMCTGYYDYRAGYTPELPGIEKYKGRVVHPQKWTPDIDYAGKRVVVIGSGATAVGLVPALAKDAAHVTMLQRSPTYMMSFPSKRAPWMAERPKTMRLVNMTLAKAIYILCRRFPDRAKDVLIDKVRQRIKAEGFDTDTHFTPRYNPWDQRLCLIRDGDLFKAINEGKVDVVTDTIATFTEKGIETSSGRVLEADLVVTATGLVMQILAGVPMDVDGVPVDLAKRAMYKTTMVDGVPNMATSLGYVNASWTLRADLVAKYVCRLLGEMDRKGYKTCTARIPKEHVTDTPIMPLASGYVARARNVLPKQGARRPWTSDQSYVGDLLALRYSAVDDGVLALER